MTNQGIQNGGDRAIFSIRAYHASDFVALYRVCLLTGDSGQDASALFKDPELLGHVYVGPYLTYEPDFCSTLTQDGVPCGYVLGARDTAAFYACCEREWYPTLRARYPLPAQDDRSPDAELVRLMHAVDHERLGLADYPAHLHIDLLPAAQGKGQGRRMIETLMARLRVLRVPGVHLGVSALNTGAIQFYARMGFEVLQAHETWIAYGMRLR